MMKRSLAMRNFLNFRKLNCYHCRQLATKAPATTTESKMQTDIRYKPVNEIPEQVLKVILFLYYRLAFIIIR